MSKEKIKVGDRVIIIGTYSQHEEANYKKKRFLGYTAIVREVDESYLPYALRFDNEEARAGDIHGWREHEIMYMEDQNDIR